MLTMVAGTRPCWEHPFVDTCRIGVESIADIHPAVWNIELCELPENVAIDEVIAVIPTGCREAGSECTILSRTRFDAVAQRISSQARPILFVLEWRKYG